MDIERLKKMKERVDLLHATVFELREILNKTLNDAHFEEINKDEKSSEKISGFSLRNLYK